MDKIWLKSYRAGIPAEIDIHEYASVNDVLAQSCRKFSGRPAFSNLGATITYADLDRLSRHFAAWLESLGLAKGTRVALMMPNLLQYPVALFGILRAGMIVVNVNPLYTRRELELQLKDSGAEAIVILENFAHVLERALPNTAVKHVVVTQAGDLLPPHQRLMVNFTVKRVKKMVPSLSAPPLISVRARRSRKPPPPTPISPFCNTPAAPPALPKAQCLRTGAWSPTCCRPVRGLAASLKRVAKPWSPRCPCTMFFPSPPTVCCSSSWAA